MVLIVDSETDYDRDGTYNGEREVRTDIGEEYPEVTPDMERAFEGRTIFDDEVTTDRWGTWVSAYSPLFDAKGKVEAVLGVDYEASSWLAAMERARLTVIGYVAVLVLLIASGSGVMAVALAAREQELLLVSKTKFETLVNSIDGIVWEADAETLRFTFVSQQVERVLGCSSAEAMAGESFWAEHVHPDSRWAVQYRESMVAARKPYQFDYQVLTVGGCTIWIRENAAVLPEKDGHALVRGVFLDITEQKQAAEDLESTHQKLMETSRHAGMAEVATGVLHNVGNVLNSVNVSSTLINDRVRTSQVGNLARVAVLLRQQGANLPQWISEDARGKAVPGLIATLADALTAEQAALTKEVRVLTKNVSHIKEIVAMQQSYAKVSGLMEPLAASELVNDALQINAASLCRHEVAVELQFEEVPLVLVDKHKVLQILVNLIRNGKQALDDSDNSRRLLRIAVAHGGEGMVAITVADTGLGIPRENLERIFSHGFTTKKNGHGFGLHSAANSAQEMNGSLTARSEGPGLGAAFILEMPIATSPATAAKSPPGNAAAVPAPAGAGDHGFARSMTVEVLEAL